MKILIADDHPLTLQSTVNIVESYGYTVSHTCSNGNAALNAIQLNHPDLAILDINMPGIDGLEVAKKVFELKLSTKIILLTMHKESALIKKAQSYHIFGYILKEKAITELKKCLEAFKSGAEYSFENIDVNIDSSSVKEISQQLTFSERKIATLLAQQKSITEISAMLFLKEEVVENHQAAILEKLAITDKNELSKKLARLNIA